MFINLYDEGLKELNDQELKTIHNCEFYIFRELSQQMFMKDALTLLTHLFVMMMNQFLSCL